MVSKTSETNLGYRLTIFREHFFKHRFFKDDKLVILTLMKVIRESSRSEEPADSALLVLRAGIEIPIEAKSSNFKT